MNQLDSATRRVPVCKTNPTAWSSDLIRAQRHAVRTTPRPKHNMGEFQAHFLACYRALQAQPRKFRRQILRLWGPTLGTAALLIVLGDPSAQAATINVGGACTLADAITAANTDAATGGCPQGDGADTLQLSAATFTYGSGLPAIAAPITIEGNGAVISGDGTAIIFQIDDGSAATKIDVTIRNLTLTGGANAGQGGAIVNRENLTIENSTITGSTATRGGAIYNRHAGALVVRNCTISGNTALTRGGGLYNADNDTMTLISNSTIAGNSTPGSGGGIYNTWADIAVVNSSLSGNSADKAAGIDNIGVSPTPATVVLVNSTVSGNSATATVGAIRNTGGNTLTLSNSIVANSLVAGVDGVDVFGGGAFSGLGKNIVEDPGTVAAFTHSTDPNVLNEDPLLEPIADNGGPTATFALSALSPALDAGDNATCESLDQRGMPRPIDGDGDGVGVCDIGAYESDDLIFLNGFE